VGSPSLQPSATASTFASASGGTAATRSAIAFGQGSRLEVLRPDALYDVAFRLEENH
jgi:hypothetical protein